MNYKRTTCKPSLDTLRETATSKPVFLSVLSLKQVHVATCGCSLPKTKGLKKKQQQQQQRKRPVAWKSKRQKSRRIPESNPGSLDWNT